MSKLEPTRTYSNPTANDILRRMLDERGVEWRYKDERTTYWYGTLDGEEWGEWAATEMGGHLHLTFSANGDVVTPAQAIAATLGCGECHDVNHGLTFVCSECGANVDTSSSIGYSYVDEFGKRWYGASNGYGLNYCPNCGAKVVYE